MLCKFVMETRKGSGKPYTPKTLLQLLTNLQSLAFERNEKACHFMNHKNIAFKSLHVINNVSKKLLADGVGAEKRQARVISVAEEELLWEKNILGSSSPSVLVHTVFYFCGLYFCLRGGVEHRELKLSQFEVKEIPNPSDSSSMIKCVI